MFALDDSSRAIFGIFGKRQTFRRRDRLLVEGHLRFLEDKTEADTIGPWNGVLQHRGRMGRSKLCRWCKEMCIEPIQCRVRRPQIQGRTERCTGAGGWDPSFRSDKRPEHVRGHHVQVGVVLRHASSPSCVGIRRPDGCPPGKDGRERSGPVPRSLTYRVMGPLSRIRIRIS